LVRAASIAPSSRGEQWVVDNAVGGCDNNKGLVLEADSDSNDVLSFDDDVSGIIEGLLLKISKNELGRGGDIPCGDVGRWMDLIFLGGEWVTEWDAALLQTSCGGECGGDTSKIGDGGDRVWWESGRVLEGECDGEDNDEVRRECSSRE
jgi:hypothetical protein